MDFPETGKRMKDLIIRYRAVLIVILAGILLMAMPKQEKTAAPPELPRQTVRDLQKDLEEILSQVEGAGRVRVLLSEAEGKKNIYQNDEDRQGDSFRSSTVVISDRERQEQGLVRQTIPARYGGAVVLAQGAGSPAVRLAIVKAVSSAAGLTSDKITVLKMK